MVFSFHLVYLSTAACISEKINLGPCWCKDFFKGQRSSTNHKMLLFVSWRNKYAIIEWPLFDTPTSIHGVFTSFSLPQYCCLHFWRNKVGSMLAQGFLRVKSQAKITNCYFLWVGAINMQSLNGHYLMSKQVPMVFLLGLLLAQGYFEGSKVKD